MTHESCCVRCTTPIWDLEQLHSLSIMLFRGLVKSNAARQLNCNTKSEKDWTVCEKQFPTFTLTFISLFFLVLFISFVNIHPFPSIPSFQACNTFQKPWDSKALTNFWCYHTFSQLLKPTEDTRRLSFIVIGVILSQSSSSGMGSSLMHFPLHFSPHTSLFTGDRSGLQACLCNMYIMCFCIVLLEGHGHPRKRGLPESIMLL